MKKTLSTIALASLTTLLLSGCPSNAEHQIIGQWEGLDTQGIAASFSFHKNHSLDMSSGGQTFKGQWGAVSNDDNIDLNLIFEGSAERNLAVTVEQQDFRTIKLVGVESSYTATLQRPAL